MGPRATGMGASRGWKRPGSEPSPSPWSLQKEHSEAALGLRPHDHGLRLCCLKPLSSRCFVHGNAGTSLCVHSALAHSGPPTGPGGASEAPIIPNPAVFSPFSEAPWPLSDQAPVLSRQHTLGKEKWQNSHLTQETHPSPPWLHPQGCG